MTTPEDNSSEDNSSEDGSSTDSTTDPPAGHRPDDNAVGTDLSGPHAPVTDEEWDRLRAPFSRHAYVVHSRAAGRVEANLPVGADEESSQADSLNQVVADLRLDILAIRDRLDLVLGPQRYSFRLEAVPDGGAERSVFCHLQIGAASRTGIGTGSGYQSARKLAIANAALAFGIGRSDRISGPIVAARESHYDVPSSVLKALETEEDRPSGRQKSPLSAPLKGPSQGLMSGPSRKASGFGRSA